MGHLGTCSGRRELGISKVLRRRREQKLKFKEAEEEGHLAKRNSRYEGIRQQLPTLACTVTWEL